MMSFVHSHASQGKLPARVPQRSAEEKHNIRVRYREEDFEKITRAAMSKGISLSRFIAESSLRAALRVK